MQTLPGFDALLSQLDQLPDYGWLYVDPVFDLESRDDIERGPYYVAQNDEDEMALEASHGTFVEAPIFRAIIENKREQQPDADRDALLDAVQYYLDNDTFQD